MSTLQQIRDKVRLQADLDDEDLPDAVLDGFIREGFDRTFANEQRWPFFEWSDTLFKDDGYTTLAYPTNVASIRRLTDTSGKILVQYPIDVLEESFVGDDTIGEPEFFAVWGGRIHLFPQPSGEGTIPYNARGYRKPLWSDDPSATLDGDERLHLPIFHYAVALAYAQQEDPDLESVYLNRWAAGVSALRDDIMRPEHDEPLILNSGRPNRWRKKLSWNI